MNERKFDSSMPIEELIKAMGWNDPEEEEETKNTPVHFEEKEEEIPKIPTWGLSLDTYINQELIVENLGHDTRGLQVVDNDSHLEKQDIRELSTQLRNEFRSVEGLLVDSKDYLVELDKLISLRGAILAGAEKKIPLIIIEQGRDLTIRRGLCANHGEWLPYLKQIGIPRTTACRHMRAYAETLCLDAPDKPKKGRTKAEDAERKQKERAYKSSLKAIGNYNYNECVAVVEEAQKRISQLRPQHHATQGYQVQPKKQTVTIDANNVHYFK